MIWSTAVIAATLGLKLAGPRQLQRGMCIAKRREDRTGLGKCATDSHYTGTHFAEQEEAGLRARLRPFLEPSFPTTTHRVNEVVVGHAMMLRAW